MLCKLTQSSEIRSAKREKKLKVFHEKKKLLFQHAQKNYPQIEEINMKKRE